MVGLTGQLQDVDLAIPQEEVQPANQRRQQAVDARKFYGPIEQQHGSMFQQAGNINPFRPLAPGSWVWVYFQDKLWVGEGMLELSTCAYANRTFPVKVIYVGGGGKSLTHNFTPTCTDIHAISRLAVQLHVPFGAVGTGDKQFYTPLVAKLPQLEMHVPTYAFLHQGNLVCSLDFRQKAMDDEEAASELFGFRMRSPKSELKTWLALMQPFSAEIMEVASKVIAAESIRRKRAEGDDDEEESAQKRLKTV